MSQPLDLAVMAAQICGMPPTKKQPAPRIEERLIEVDTGVPGLRILTGPYKVINTTVQETNQILADLVQNQIAIRDNLRARAHQHDRRV